MRQVVIDYLTDGSMYLQMGQVLYQHSMETMWELIQKLSHDGVYVMSENDQAVTDQQLMTKTPFNLVGIRICIEILFFIDLLLSLTHCFIN